MSDDPFVLIDPIGRRLTVFGHGETVTFVAPVLFQPTRAQAKALAAELDRRANTVERQET